VGAGVGVGLGVALATDDGAGGVTVGEAVQPARRVRPAVAARRWRVGLTVAE
jgi:hypothetical protein